MRKDQSIPDYLKIEQLYVRVVDYIAAVERGEEFSETEMKLRLEPILAMGAAIGRRSALDELRYPDELKDLRAVVERLTRDLSQVKSDPYHLPLGLSAARRVLREYADVARLETGRCRYGFEDRLINEWLKVVDGDVPRETSADEEPSDEGLTPPQRDRLLKSARLVTAAFEALIRAKALEVPRSVLLGAEASFNQDMAVFDRMRAVRGLLPGDLIEITVGCCAGEQGVIKEWEFDVGPHLVIDWPEDSPCRNGGSVLTPHSREVNLVTAEYQVPGVPRETSESASG